MTFSIRPMRKSDAKAVVGLFQEFVAYLHSLKSKASAGFSEKAFMQDGFGPKPAFVGWVVVQNKKIVGYLIGNYGYETAIPGSIFHIVDLYVTASARREGIARSLMKTAARSAAKSGAKALFWGVYKPNHSANRFYEKFNVRKLDKFHFMVLDKDALKELVRP